MERASGSSTPQERRAERSARRVVLSSSAPPRTPAIPTTVMRWLSVRWPGYARRASLMASTRAQQGADSPFLAPADHPVPRSDVPEHPLAQVDVFRGLRMEHLLRLDRAGRLLHAPAGQVLVKEGVASDMLFAVLDGQVRTSVQGMNGTITLRVAGPLESVPVAVLVEPWLAVTTARTLTPSTLFAIPRREVMALCEEDAEAGMTIYRAAAMVLARRYQAMLERASGRA